MKITPAPLLTLSNGVEMPRLGLGTWPMNDSEAAETVALALDMGYRLIDTAENYENERGVGEGIRRAGVARGELFVTTKFNRKWHSVEGARQACEASLERLGLDYIDLFLVHWPNPDQGRYVEAFEGLVKLQEAGLVRAIGTSNFKPAHLQQLFDRGLCPQVNQIHLDPWHARSDHIEVHEARGIVTESWSPLGRANAMLADPVILDVARRHGRTPAQVILRWHTQLGYVPIPKSSNPTRLAENLDVFGFELSAEELAAIGALDRPDPEMLDSDVFGH
ncbi:MAG TPA: aldo/keto reductase [Thauera aminoaromatica]|jgi:2,5-diketo-D-gluconate reductase A|uniref:Aldo/keto reductase n=2 Tax=Thauera aminoaromatica TaxID=164330 RepID=N6XNM8_THASP|nr:MULTISPECIES: aldo/keto reductase [Thauera]OPZ04912.1 MAG: putative oxidoreductase [Alphaproteobacteria bacterium ADurb.BinA305]TMW72692.1 aldo/keto reductase [Thauera sp. UPWRP]ACR02652.1 aldo/keto reductase [Thauera aminoaromatica]ENO80960.1 aldo/keto reductase [Thauera aminoaromatica S2]MBL8462717.1 aldo/keto reductase [Thauera sp.]